MSTYLGDAWAGADRLAQQCQFAVFPVNDDKTPAVNGGFKSASKEPTKIRSMFAAARNAPYAGIATGRVSNIFVIDIDVDKDKVSGKPIVDENGQPTGPGFNWYSENKQRLGLPIIVTTRSGGLHLIYQYHEGIGCNANQIHPRVDLRGDRGYIVAWDPTAFFNGRLHQAPDWLIETTLKKKARGRGRPHKDKTANAADNGPSKPAYTPSPPKNRPAAIRALARHYIKIALAENGTVSQTLYNNLLPLTSMIGDHLAAAEVVFAAVRAGMEAGHPYQRILSTLQSGFSANSISLPEEIWPDAGDGAPKTFDEFWKLLKKEIDGQRNGFTITEGRRNRPEPTMGNALIILAQDERLEGIIKLDTFSQNLYAMKEVPNYIKGATYPQQWTDEMTLGVKAYLEREHAMVIPTVTLFEALINTGATNSFNQLQDYFDGLPTWDGVPRIERLFVRGFGAEDNELNRAFGRCHSISATARALKPGCKVDNVVVIEGAQGIGKSRALKTLYDPWLTESLSDINKKDAQEELRGAWCIELAEITHLIKTETEVVKSFFTRTTDRYRASYGRLARDYPRTCVFVGTTNDLDYLKDTTGNRRYWTIAAGAIDLEWIAANRAQLWAEAYRRFNDEEQWHLNADLELLAVEQQEKRSVEDAWAADIAGYCRGKKSVRTQLIMSACLRLGAKDRGATAERRIVNVLRKLGYAIKREWVDGVRARVYVPDTDYARKIAAMPEVGDNGEAI